MAVKLLQAGDGLLTSGRRVIEYAVRDAFRKLSGYSFHDFEFGTEKVLFYRLVLATYLCSY